MEMGSFGFELVVVLIIDVEVVTSSAIGVENTNLLFDYFCDGKKIPSGDPFFETLGVQLIELDETHDFLVEVINPTSANPYG